MVKKGVVTKGKDEKGSSKDAVKTVIFIANPTLSSSSSSSFIYLPKVSSNNEQHCRETIGPDSEATLELLL